MIIPEKFLAKINKTDSCWLWLGHINNSGYGRDNSAGYPSRYAHRSMFYWANGYLPSSPSVVGHKCEVRKCVNPDHLEDQTQKQNVRQYSDRITHCPTGHEYTETNTYIRSNGSRKCRECNRLNEAKKRKAGQ